ncbi:MAG: hypothetical protein V1853_04640 [bacterium]
MKRQRKKAPILIPIIVILGVAFVIWLIIGRGTAPSIQESNNSTNTTNSITQGSNSNFSLYGGEIPARGYIPDTTISVQDLPKTESDCSGQDGNWIWDEQFCLPSDQETCEEFGARWEQLQANAEKTCVIQTSDGNSDCTDSDECEGRCFAPTLAVSGSTQPDDELSGVTGSCGYFIPTPGCFPEVNQGMVGVVCL